MTGTELTMKAALIGAEKPFKEANEFGLVSWQQESGFVGQALRANDYLAKCNPRSIQDSVVNLAAIGISLNPAMKLAYLVPRDGKCVLDISYMGLIKIATDTGSIQWAKADIVYEADEFEYLGPADKPRHACDPFRKDRGEPVGTYCVAKTLQGDYLTEVMSKDDLDEVRSKSMLYTSKKSGPWVDWWGEMAKKTVIKRASKTWPKTEKTVRLDKAIHVLNRHEGLVDPEYSGKVLVNEDEQRKLEAAITDYGLSEEIVLRALGVSTLEQLPAEKFDSAMNLIKQARNHETDH